MLVAFAHMNRFAVEERSFPEEGRVELINACVIDGRKDGFVVNEMRNHDRVVGEAFDKILRPADRINNPDVFRSLIGVVFFLCEEEMVISELLDNLLDASLNGEIFFRDVDF